MVSGKEGPHLIIAHDDSVPSTGLFADPANTAGFVANPANVVVFAGFSANIAVIATMRAMGSESAQMPLEMNVYSHLYDHSL